MWNKDKKGAATMQCLFCDEGHCFETLGDD
jgi:hypothetical protein